MLVLVVGLSLFLGLHAVGIVGLREAAVARLGEGPWKGLYAIGSAVGLGLIVWGYGAARLHPVVVWIPPPWTRHLALTVMVPVFPLLLAAYLPGRIRAVTTHPMLLATTLWAAAHLACNGMLADVALFGSFLIWSIADRLSLTRRGQRPIPGAPPGAMNDLIAIVLGLAIYVATLLEVHRWLIGVAPVG